MVKVEKYLALRLDAFFGTINEIHFFTYTKITILDYANFLNIFAWSEYGDRSQASRKNANNTPMYVRLI